MFVIVVVDDVDVLSSRKETERLLFSSVLGDVSESLDKHFCNFEQLRDIQEVISVSVCACVVLAVLPLHKS